MSWNWPVKVAVPLSTTVPGPVLIRLPAATPLVPPDWIRFSWSGIGLRPPVATVRFEPLRSSAVPLATYGLFDSVSL